MRYTPVDKPSDYYNLVHPHLRAAPDAFKHRLGNFKTNGIGSRPDSPFPFGGCLHDPEADYFYGQGGDPTAERVAAYLADHIENYQTLPDGKPNPYYDPSTVKHPRIGCTHAAADRDSYVLGLPSDSQCWGCGNSNTAKRSWEVEIAGFARLGSEYWRSPEGKSKLHQAAIAHVHGAKLAFGEAWRLGVVPPQRAVLDHDGTIIETGWFQHRDVPYWVNGEWIQAPNSWKFGQHTDICDHFPFEVFFSILADEINRAAAA